MKLTSKEAIELNIGEIWHEYYLPEKTARRRADTVAGYVSSAELHVLPRWSSLTIAELDRDDIQDWVDELAKTEAGPGGAWKAYKCLRQVVNWAIDKWLLMVGNATRGIEKPRCPTYHAPTLTSRRLTRLIQGLEGFAYAPTVLIQSAIGLRPGENYALDWKDIGWRDGAVRIYKTLQQVKGELHIDPTKTEAGERIVYLPKWALSTLHEIWVALGRPKGRIIGSTKPSQVRYAFKRWLKVHRLPKITMQNLRHTIATLMVEAGVSIEVVAAILGHSSVQTSYRYYVKNTKRSQRKAHTKLARILKPNVRLVPIAPTGPIEVFCEGNRRFADNCYRQRIAGNEPGRVKRLCVITTGLSGHLCMEAHCLSSTWMDLFNPKQQAHLRRAS